VVYLKKAQDNTNEIARVYGMTWVPTRLYLKKLLSYTKLNNVTMNYWLLLSTFKLITADLAKFGLITYVSRVLDTFSV
jgi:hypothetical protein